MAPGLAKVAVVIGVGPGERACRNMLSCIFWPCSRTELQPMFRAGIGAAAAKKFASKGYTVALLSRNMDKLTPVESEITKAGGKALSLPTDAGLPSRSQTQSCRLTYDNRSVG